MKKRDKRMIDLKIKELVSRAGVENSSPAQIRALSQRFKKVLKAEGSVDDDALQKWMRPEARPANRATYNTFNRQRK